MRSIDAYPGAAAILIWALMGIQALVAFQGAGPRLPVPPAEQCPDGGISLPIGCESVHL